MLRSNTGTYTVDKPPAWLEYVRDEHIHTRTKVSLFDVSSFAKLHVQGKDALSAMQRLCCADVSDLNRAVYVVFERDAREFHTFMFQLLMSSSATRENANCITRSWNINRAFSLFLGYAIDRHGARTQVRYMSHTRRRDLHISPLLYP